MSSARPTTYFLLAAGMTLFGSATPVSRLLSGFPPLAATGLRMLTAGLVLSPFLIAARGDLRRLKPASWVRIVVIAAVGCLGFSLALLAGMRLVSGVVGSVVMSTTPAVTGLAAWLFLGERMGWPQWTALLLAVSGVAVLHVGGGGESDDLVLGTLAVFVAVCCEATYTLVGKVETEHLGSTALAAVTTVLAALLFAPFVAIGLGDLAAAPTRVADWVALLWWGAGTMGLGSLLWYAGVARVGGTVAAGFMAVMPVSALVLSYVLLGEPFRWHHLGGFALVFAGVLLTIRSHMRMARDS